MPFQKLKEILKRIETFHKKLANILQLFFFNLIYMFFDFEVNP